MEHLHGRVGKADDGGRVAQVHAEVVHAMDELLVVTGELAAFRAHRFLDGRECRGLFGVELLRREVLELGRSPFSVRALNERLALGT